MNILVVAGKADPLWMWGDNNKTDHNIVIETPDNCVKTPDAIISMSISLMEETYQLIERFPDVPLFCYNWDCYEWIWKHPRGYDWNRYGELLKRSTQVWVPSICTGLRTKQWWGIDNWKVILSGVPIWNYPNRLEDEGYALCCLRKIPDPFWGKFEQACKELGIPHIMTDHTQSWDEYKKIVAGCSFICAPLYELSTGGLSLLEAYHIGKPCLVSDSEWNGARDYMGDRATYFRHDDWEDFKSQLVYMLKMSYVPQDHSSYVTNNFSYKRMVNDMIRSVHESTHSHV